jgi:hypothetical protein
MLGPRVIAFRPEIVRSIYEKLYAQRTIDFSKVKTEKRSPVSPLEDVERVRECPSVLKKGTGAKQAAE